MSVTVIKQGHTQVPVYTGDGQPGDRATAQRLINARLEVFPADMRDATDLDLAHRARDLEALAWASPAVDRMRQIVADVQHQREVSRG